MIPAFRAITLVLVLVAIICLSACAEKKLDREPELQLIDHNLSIQQFGSDVLQSIAAVNGKAKNNSDITISSASVNVSFYDKDGSLLHTASTIKQNLAAGELWIFNVQFASPDAWKIVRYDISVNATQ